MKLKNKILLLSLSFLLFISCNTKNDTCRKPRDVNFRVSFFLDTVNVKTQKREVFNLSVDSLWIKGIGRDKFLYKNDKKISEIVLPLNKFKKKSIFEVKFNTVVDTIEVVHRNFSEYLSLNCGTIITYEIDTVYSTKHFIDSLSIKNKKVNIINAKHLQIHHFK